MSQEVNVNDLVWAQLKGYPYWPAMISKSTVKPPKRNMLWCFFFGTYNFGWVEIIKIKPYLEHKSTYVNNYRSNDFKKAVQDVEDILTKQKEDPDYTFDLSPYAIQQPANNASQTPQTSSSNEVVEDEANRDEDTNVSPEKSVKPTSTRKQSRTSSVKRSAEQSKSASSSSKRRKTAEFSRETNDENGDTNDEIRSDSVGSNSLLNENSNSAADDGNYSQTSDKKFGFLGLGNMGMAIVKNLIDSGHELYVWNRDEQKCKEVENYAKNPNQVTVCTVPRDVIENADITFSCLSDPKSVKGIFFNNCGVIPDISNPDMLKGKGYVEMTGIDPETSQNLGDTIEKFGGKYLEAQIQGSKNEAVKGDLIMLCAGNQELFKNCNSCLRAMGKMAFYLGRVGYATKTNLILQLIKGISLAGMAEAFALADRCTIAKDDLLKIFVETNMANPYLIEKAKLFEKESFKTNVQQAVELMQKDMNLAINFADSMKQSLIMGSTANEVYKSARRLGYDTCDAACIFIKNKY